MSLLISTLFTGCFNREEAYQGDTVIYSGANLEIRVPAKALAPGEVVICAKNNTPFHAWTVEDHLEADALIAKISTIWKQHEGVQDYTVWTRDTASDHSRGWSVVPFPRPEGITARIVARWHQFQALWRALFGGYEVTQRESQDMAAAYQPYLGVFDGNIAPLESSPPTRLDAFCRNDVIERQQIYLGDHVRLLYNYAPLGEGHFLITTVKHRATFDELTEEEHREVALFAQVIAEASIENGSSTIYHLHKTGENAGMTEAHWHQHMIVMAPENETIHKIKAVVRFVWPSILPPNELARVVEDLKLRLTGPLQQRTSARGASEITEKLE